MIFINKIIFRLIYDIILINEKDKMFVALFIEMLDMNQMYVNFSERSDKKYEISEDDIALSEDFYNVKK